MMPSLSGSWAQHAAAQMNKALRTIVIGRLLRGGRRDIRYPGAQESGIGYRPHLRRLRDQPDFAGRDGCFVDGGAAFQADPQLAVVRFPSDRGAWLEMYE